VTDGAVGDAAVGPLARDTLLGRGNDVNGMVVNRAHWSYFFNTGGSPMEGNLWTEIAPGQFRTERPSFRFSDFDLYNMGLVPPTAVRPSFLIAEPTMLPRNITRDSAPEYSGRTVTIGGRRVGVSIDDIIAANGRRSPAYPDTPRDLDVVWVLWVEPDQVDDDLVAEFDQAIESCALGYDTASGNLSRLVATTPFVEPPDAGFTPDAGFPDVGTPDAGSPDAAATADAGGDAGVTADGPAPVAPHAEGGCACSTSAPARGTSGLPLAGLALALGLARRRRRAARRREVVASGA
jgi:MYXO-CTERM domain-containing protein